MNTHPWKRTPTHQLMELIKQTEDGETRAAITAVIDYRFNNNDDTFYCLHCQMWTKDCEHRPESWTPTNANQST